jgi:putative flippase GtrA
MPSDRWRAPLTRVGNYIGIQLALFPPFNLGVGWALTEFGIDYKIATIVGFFVQATIGFFLNRWWTFQAEVKTSTGLVKTWGIAVFNLALAVGLTTVFIEYVGLSFLPARIGAAVIALLWGYVLNARFTFKTKILR